MSQKEVINLNYDYLENINSLDNFVKVANATVSKKDLNKRNVAVLLQDGDTFGFTLLTICLICYGEDTFKLDPLVLYQYLKEDFGVELNPDNENKLNALITALTTNYFFKDLAIFKSICQTLTEEDPGVFDASFDDPTVVEVLWGMYEVSLVYDDKDKDEYSPEIEAFVNKALKTDPNDIEESGLTDEETYQEFIINNVADLKQQLIDIGLKDLPKFPNLEF